MDFDPAELDALSREDLILRARARGVERPEQMTRVELRDEIVRMSEPDLERQRRTRGWLGVARDLLASVVESGLNLPDAAAAIRGDAKADLDFQGPPPVATVTLAEIYAAQGHYEQALRMLEEVIEREPEHSTARALHQRLTDERDLGPGRRRRVVPTTTATPAPPQVAPATDSAAPAAKPVVAVPEPAVPAVVAEPAVATAPVPAPPADEPVAAEPAAPEPAAAPAAVEAPELVAAEAVAAEPAAPEPAAPAAVEAPAPAIAQPATEASEPVVAEPAAQPVVSEPVAAEPAVEPAAAASARDTDAATDTQLLVLHTLHRAFVYWRLPAAREELRLRSVTVRPSPAGPRVEEEDYRLPIATGGFWLPRFESGTEVRVAIGRVTGDGFAPLAVARVVSDEPEASFEPPGVSVDAALEAAARSAARL